MRDLPLPEPNPDGRMRPTVQPLGRLVSEIWGKKKNLSIVSFCRKKPAIEFMKSNNSWVFMMDKQSFMDGKLLKTK